MWPYLASLVFGSIVFANGKVVRDFGNQPTIIDTDSLPLLDDGHTIDADLMPSVGNGHIATIVYNDTIYMNGIFSGQLSDSHRARIPAEINMRVRVRDEDRRQVYRQYRLDMKNGYWEENITVEECRVTQRVYAHQFYTRLLVVEILAKRQGAATGNLVIHLITDRGSNSEDINFTKPDSFNGGNWRSQGSTKDTEVPGGHNSIVYAFWSTVTPVIQIPSYRQSIRFTYIMSIDTNHLIARESFTSGSLIADRNPDLFFRLHKESWQKKWEGGGIELSGDVQLGKLACSSFYYILSSLPSIVGHREMNPFGGISSGGLANGGVGEAVTGQVSWDQERWISPAMLPFYPKLVQSLLSYRVDTMTGAAVEARQRGYKGVLFPWRSAATGIDLTPSYEPRNHYHLNGDIAFAVRQYMSLTRDRQWMQKEGACSLVQELSKFWYSKLRWNNRTLHYDLLDVTTPDATRGSVDNSVYTNALASLTLHYSKYAACLCNVDVNEYAPQEWLHAAQNLHWEHNNTSRYNPEYQGYVSKGVHQTIKQSGAVMLGYPLMWKVPVSAIERNLRTYSAVIPDSSSSTAWAMLTINRLALGQEDLAHKSFLKSYKPYVSGPYKTWMEYKNGGRSNYLSGMGAYLQVLLYGYGGLRIHLEHLYMHPRLPKNVHRMTFRDINYLGSRFHVRVTGVLVHVTVQTIGIYPLRLKVAATGRSYPMTSGTKIPIERGAFTITSKAKTQCPLPDDNIIPYSKKYTPASYLNSTRSGAASQQTPLSLTVIILCWTVIIVQLSVSMPP